MRYHDLPEQSRKLQALANDFLLKQNLSANPINYAVAYEYVDGKNLSLIERVDKLGQLDNFSCETIFSDCILVDNAIDKGVMNDFTNALKGLSRGGQQSQQAISNFVQTLDRELDNSELNQKLAHASRLLIEQQQELLKQVELTQKHNEMLQAEMERVQKQTILDPLTGLYNQAGMLQQIDVWHQKNKANRIMAIAIDIDRFSDFNAQFGQLIGDVVLTKVAQQIKKYVMDLGFPVRYSGEEFLILMPHGNDDTAMEIAEEIRKAVNRMRFVSAKTKAKLPPISISAGIASLRKNEFLERLIERAQKAVVVAKANGRNQVMHESRLQ